MTLLDTTLVAAAGLYEWLLFGHVLAAMIWVGGALLLSVIAASVLRDRDPDAITRFVRSLSVIGPRVFAPSVVTLLGLGVGLVVKSDAWTFDQGWVQLAFGLFASAFLIGIAYLSRAAIAADRAATAGAHDEAARHLQRWLWGYRLVVAILTVAVWDMVAKPGIG